MYTTGRSKDNPLVQLVSMDDNRENRDFAKEEEDISYSDDVIESCQSKNLHKQKNINWQNIVFIRIYSLNLNLQLFN